jgi:arylsulfatase A-like enzyme
LFLFSDDQRADTIHALGNPQIQTPNLDRLVKTGLTFTRAYCMGGLQGAVCVPSRAMHLSGRSLFRISEKLEKVTTWPMVFEQAGYDTYAIGKWHNGPAALTNSFAAGRAIFFGGMTDQNRVPAQDLGPGRVLGSRHTNDQHSSELFADAAIDFLRRHKADKPFCLYVAFTMPHDPRTAPKNFRARYNSDRLPLPKNFLPQHPFNNGEMLVRDEKLERWPRSPEAIRRHLADYYAAITHLDAQIGRILKALKRTGRYDDTLIVFASDHGLALGSHGLMGKQNLYEHSMRAPLILAGRGIPRGKRSEAFCYLLDLYPTLCDLAGLSYPDTVEGLSLLPVIQGRQPSRRDSIFTAYRHVQRAVRDAGWKLIRYPHVNQTQLFDLRADPEERHDLAGVPNHQSQVERLTQLLQDWQQQLGDTLALSTTKPAPLQIELK